MDSDMQYLRDRVDGIADTLSRNTVILENNTESLKEHMRRTAALEEQMQVALLPIKVARILAWVIGVLGTLAAVFSAFR